MIAADYTFYDADLPGGYLVAPALAHGLINASFEIAIGAEWTLATGATRSAATAANGGVASLILTGAAASQARASQVISMVPVTDERDYWRVGELAPLFVRFYGKATAGVEPVGVRVETMLGAVVVETFEQVWTVGAGHALASSAFASYRAGPFLPTTAAYDAVRVTVGLLTAAGGSYTVYLDDIQFGAMLDTNDLNRGFFEDALPYNVTPDSEMSRMEDGTIDGWLFNDGIPEGEFVTIWYDDVKRVEITEPFDRLTAPGTPVTICGHGNTLERDYIPEAVMLYPDGKRGQDEQMQHPDWTYRKSWRGLA